MLLVSGLVSAWTSGDWQAADSYALACRLGRACQLLDCIGLGDRSADLRTATGGQIAGICDAVTQLIERARAERNVRLHADAMDARDALGALWCVL